MTWCTIMSKKEKKKKKEGTPPFNSKVLHTGWNKNHLVFFQSLKLHQCNRR